MRRNGRAAGVPHGERAARSDTSETRLALICAAERLFAEQGLRAHAAAAARGLERLRALA